MSERRGLEGKWAALTDEREGLKQDNEALRDQVQKLLAERKSAEEIKEFGLSFNAEETEVMSALSFAYEIICRKWDLKGNEPELVSALHTLQGFVQQHMLTRLAPDKWASWWAKQPEGPSTNREPSSVRPLQEPIATRDPTRPRSDIAAEVKAQAAQLNNLAPTAKTSEELSEDQKRFLEEVRSTGPIANEQRRKSSDQA